MNYNKLVSEVSKLYDAFRNDFGIDDSLAFTKICLREFPIFREMIEYEPVPPKIIGYVCFKDGTKEAIIDSAYVNSSTYDYFTEEYVYRQHEYLGRSFDDIGYKYQYTRHSIATGKNEIMHNIKDIELIKEGLK